MDEEKQTTEVKNSTAGTGANNVARQTVTTHSTVSGGVMLKRVVYYLGGVIIVLILVRFMLLLFGANPSNSFVDFIYNLSGVFVWPFYGIFNYQPSYGSSTLEVSSIVAIVIYALLAWGIGKLVTLNSNSPEA